MQTGLFTRQDLITVRPGISHRGKPPAERFSASHYQAQGLDGVRRMNPAAKNPNMPPSGVKYPLVYVLGEGPGEYEDVQGEPFVGKAGQTLRSALPRGYEKITRFDNVVRTRPPENRIPTFEEIECYRKTIEASIEEAKPVAILGTGYTPAQWALGYGTKKMVVLHGRRFPVRIGGHCCWFYSVHHPSYINRIKDAFKTEDDVPGAEIKRCFEYEVRQCYLDAEKLQDQSPPHVYDDPKPHLEGAEYYWEGDHKKVLALIDSADQGIICGNDLETNRLRPYSQGSKILSVSLATQDVRGAFALDHPQARWTKDQRAAILERLEAFVCSSTPKIAHNLAMELEWYAVKMGTHILRKGNWHCTQAQSFILDPRNGGHSLDFCCLQSFGTHLKAFSNVNRENLQDEDIRKVLSYNLLDSVFARLLYLDQKRRIKNDGMLDVYREQIRRVPSAVTAQIKGFPVDAIEVKKHKESTVVKIAAAKKKIAESPEADTYNKQFGQIFNPNSPQQCVKMFRDLLGRKEGQTKKGYSTDKKILLAMNLPFADDILELKQLIKLKGTYIDPFDITTADSLVYPDRRMHCSFNTTFTSTNRTSSDSPNMQNIPARKNKEIRSMFCPGKGRVILKADYGQLEFRVMAMASKDPVIVDAVWNNYDVHMVWAEKINKVYPKACKERFGGFDTEAMKEWRSYVKSYFVFAAFYGSHPEPISQSLGVPMNVFRKLFEEFWDMFKGVKKWQLKGIEYYRANGYITTMTGYRRYAPMSDNMIFNTPIQSAGSDILVDSWNRLNEMSLESNDLDLSPNLNVHDDLTFELAENKLDYCVPIIGREMLRLSFPFINVPLSVEFAVGSNWSNTKEIGKFTSDKMPESWKKHD